jgi:hypothetical protein
MQATKGKARVHTWVRLVSGQAITTKSDSSISRALSASPPSHERGRGGGVPAGGGSRVVPTTRIPRACALMMVERKVGELGIVHTEGEGSLPHSNFSSDCAIAKNTILKRLN